MARLPRVVAVDVAHHVTQRGNAQRDIFDCETDRVVYLELLERYAQLHGLDVAAYCLMPNHVHIVATPRHPDSLPLTMKYTHGRFAAYRNTRSAVSGHVWQGRYYSCPLDEGHFWAAMRYVERNPVRAGLADTPAEYRWSSAAAHCGAAARGPLTVLAIPRDWSGGEWSAYLVDDDPPTEEALRRATHCGRPIGSEEFVRRLETELGRRLAPSSGGRPRKQDPSAAQDVFTF